MSRTIDERVVEMRFDNKEFESGVKQSLTSLDKLKKALDLEGSTKSFEKIDEAANNISLEGITAGIEALQKRFSTLGIVGMRIIENITDSLMGMASKAVNYISDAILSGGLRRAQNIENAHFQLQALLKDEEAVQAVMDNAMASVDGTAYAYDEAAKAAAQFAASGMRAGEEMEGALIGITGVAAMTNSEYEAISRIFTTVAGNGRLMGDQLLQLSSRGLNAAATIADYFREVQGLADITEADVREMVSDSEISFKIFADAMNWAFGESAFRANETFTGALSNMRSALARIGAEFFSPLIEQNSDLILLINTLRERFNDIKKGLTFDEQRSAISGLTKVTGATTATFEDLFHVIKEDGSVSTDTINNLSEMGVNALADLTRYINGVTSGSIRTTYATKSALSELTGDLLVNKKQVREFIEEGKIDLKTFTSAMETAYGDQKALSKQFTTSVLDAAKSISEYLKSLDLSKPLSLVYYGVESVKNVFKGLYSVIKPIGKAFSEVFLTFGMDDVLNLADKIETLTSKMKLSETGSQNLHDAFKGVFDIAKLLVDAVLALFNAFVPVEKPVSSLGEGLLNLAGSAGRSLSKFAEWVRNSPAIQKAYEFISEKIQIASTWVANFIDNLDEFIDRIKQFPFVQSAIQFVTDAFDSLRDILGKVEIRFAPFKSILDGFMTVVKTVGPIISSIIKGIAKAIGFLFTSVSDGLKEGGFNSFVDLLNSGVFVGLAYGISKFIENISRIVNRAGGIFSNINANLLVFKRTLLEYQAQLKAKVLKTIAVSVAILAGALFVLAMIDSDKLGASLGVVTVLIAELAATLAIFSKTVSKLQSGKISMGLIGLSTSVLILSIAMKTLSGIDSDKLLGSLASISALLIEMTGVAIVLSKYGGKVKTGVLSIIAFSAAIYILASSVRKLGEMDVDVLGKGLISVFILLAELSAFMVGAKFGNFKPTQAIAIIGLSAALLILQKAVEGFGNIDEGVLSMGIVAIASLLAALGAFTFVAGQSKHILSTAASLVIISYALKQLEGPMQVFGSMTLGEIGKGLLAIGVALAEITIALLLMPKDTLLIGAGLLVVAKALTVITDAVANMSFMSWGEIGKSMVVLAGSMIILSVSMNAMQGTLGGAAAMVVMTAALSLFAPVLKTLGGMAWSEIAKGLTALGGAFAVIGVAGLLLGPIIPAIIGLATAMTLLGVACIGIGAGIAIFSVGLKTLSTLGVASAASIIEVIRILILGVLNTISDSVEAIGDTIKSVILVCCDVIIQCAPKIVETVLVVVDEILASLADHAPSIVHSLLEFILGLVNALRDDLPEVIQAVVGLFTDIFSGIVDVLKGIDASKMPEGLVLIGMFTALMYALSGLRLLAPGAIQGVLAMGVVIGALTILLAAVGALAQTPGLTWLIGEGGNLLQGIGTAIGQFVGGIVGGLMSGVSSQFPQIGSDLSAFMENAQPFLEGASKIDANMMQGVQSLAKTILLLTAADILQGLTSWFTGGSSLSAFGEELAQFGKPFSQFAEDVKDINPEVVSGAANAALVLADMADTLPNSGGLAGKIFGESSLSDFGKELEAFAPHLRSYADAVKDVDPEIVNASASAAQVLADMASTLPNSGGLSAKIFGDNTLSSFGEELEKFGPHLAQYGDDVKNVDPAVVSASVRAAQVLADMASTLPNSGGLASLILGDNTLSSFGEELSKFGPYISEYAKEVSGIDPSVVINSANAAKALVEMQNALGTSGGIISWFTGDNDLKDFGKGLKSFGQSLSAYAESVVGIDVEHLDGVIDEVQKLIGIANRTSSLDTSGMTDFGKSLKTMGDNGIDALIKAFDDSISRVRESVASLMDNIDDRIVTSGKTIEKTAKTIGENIVVAIQTGMKNKESSILMTVRSLCMNLLSETKSSLPSVTFTGIGESTMTALSNGVNNKKAIAISTSREVCNAVVSEFNRSLPSSTFNTNGAGIVTALSTGIDSKKSSVTKSAKDICSSTVETIRNNLKKADMEDIGSNVAEGLAKGISSKINSIRESVVTAASEAIRSAKETLEVRSPSRVFRAIGEFVSIGLAKGIADKISAVSKASEKMGEESINTMNDVVQRISDVINDDPNFDPVIKPVMDLSNVEAAADEISSMFQRFNLSSTYGKALEVSGSFNARRRVNVSGEDDSTGVNDDGGKNVYIMNQNNYSPKSLSRSEIYRQTKSLFSRLEEVTK